MEMIIEWIVELLDVGLEYGEERGFLSRWIAFAIRAIFWAVLEAAMVLITVLLWQTDAPLGLKGLITVLLLCWSAMGFREFRKMMRE